jgi:hypothetical protein
VNSIGEPDAANLHVRFDEREAETERWTGLRYRHPGESRRLHNSLIPKATAPPLDSTAAATRENDKQEIQHDQNRHHEMQD